MCLACEQFILHNSLCSCYICEMNINKNSFDAQEERKSGSGHPSGPHQPIGYDITVNDKPVKMPERVATGKDILEKSGHVPISCFFLYMKLAGCDFEKITIDQEIDLKNPGLERFVTKEADIFPYKINNDPELTQEKTLTARSIIKYAGLDPEKVYLVQRSGEQEEILAFDMDEPICMHCKGLHFITREWLDTVDIEEYGKQCKLVPPARHYQIKIDKDKFSWSSPVISVEQVIRFVHKDNPANYNLVKFLGNSPKPVPVPYTEAINLLEPCLLRFVIQPKTQNDGYQSGFSLPEEDTDYLNALGFPWEALAENNYLWLVIHNYPLPEGYEVKNCSVALMIPPNYPAAEIDMAYFYPQLQKTSGRAINATSTQPIGNQIYQRWSRHRLPNEWKPGIDNVGTHLILVNNWLENDIKR